MIYDKQLILFELIIISFTIRTCWFWRTVKARKLQTTWPILNDWLHKCVMNNKRKKDSKWKHCKQPIRKSTIATKLKQSSAAMNKMAQKSRLLIFCRKTGKRKILRQNFNSTLQQNVAIHFWKAIDWDKWLSPLFKENMTECQFIYHLKGQS